MDDGSRPSALSSRRIGSLVGAVIGLVGLVFVARRLISDWDEFSEAIRSASPVWLVLALLCGLAAMSTIGWNWLRLLRPHGAAEILGKGSAWFFVGQLGKYVPGGIWPVVGQAELAARAGSTRATAYSATAISMIATLLGAVVVAVAAGVVSTYDHRLLAAGAGFLVIVGFAVLALDSFRRRVSDLLHRVTRRRIDLPASRALARQTVRHLPVWLLFSALNVCVHRSLGGAFDLGLTIELALVTCVSWIAGFVVIGVPGGIGVREAVFVSMMTGPVGASLAVSMAVTSRVVSIVVDLLGAGAAVTASRAAPATA